MQSTLRRFVVAALVVGVAAGFGGWGLQDTRAQMGPSGEAHQWALKAQRPVIIGGYGDNFAYDGKNVRPLKGTATLELDVSNNAGTVVGTLQTTPESGPLFVAQRTTMESGIRKVTHEYLEGTIRLEMKLDAEGARFQEFAWLHGDTGNEAPVMPNLFNFLAGWAPLDVYVNGELAYENLAGHFMYSEQARREDGTIRRDDGTIYSPSLEDKTRFTVPDGREFHLVAHSTEPDPDNFPPHTEWIHLMFYDVFLQKAPEGADVSTN